MGAPKTPADVRAVFGEPERTWTETPTIIDINGKVVARFDEYTGWDYKPLPGYWLGSKFQVFFKRGVVSGVEANDD